MSQVRPESLQMGLRYTTPAFSAGAIVNPTSTVLQTAWAVSSPLPIRLETRH